MTVQSQTSRADYTGNGSTTTFTVPFYFLDASHITVLRTQVSTGVITTLALSTDYTVTGAGVSSGGSITCVTAPTTGQKISILRSVPLTQLTHYVENDPFPAASHERVLDQLTMEVQQVSEVAGRALQLPPNTPSSSVSTTLPTPSANKLLAWNGAATGLQNVDSATLVTVAAYGTTQADVFTGDGVTSTFTLTANPGAIGNLDVSIGGVTQIPNADYFWASGTVLTTSAPVPNGVKLLVRYGQVLPSGGGTSAPSSADLISYDPLQNYADGCVGAELRRAQSQVEHLWHAIRVNQRDVYLLVTGDSTGNETTEWVYLISQWLATQCPTHTVKYRLFNDGTTSWDAYTTLQTGSGPALPFTGTPFTIYVDNGSVSGTNTFYTQGGRESSFWTGNEYDLVIVNYGHNLGTAMTEAIALPEWAIALAHCRMMAPRAGLLVTLQNPRSSSTNDINTNGSAQSARMVAAWRKAADLIGASVIDVYTAFKTNPSYASLMADETHPNSAGQLVWANAVKRVFAEPRVLTGDAPIGYNPLAEQRPNYAPNPRFGTWTGATPDGWTFTNCTATKETGVTDGTLYSLRVNIGAGLNPQITADVSSYLAHLRGKTVTFVARIWRPSGLGLLTGRCEIASTDNVTSSSSFISYPRGTPSQGGWEWVQATLTIPRVHTQLTLRFYAGAADGSDSGKVFYIASAWFGEGVLPGGVGIESAASKFVLDFYSSSNAGKITGNTGTLNVSGTTITLSGAPTTASDVYVNLPGLTAGKQYKVTFDATSATGNTAGGLYIRNGYNGGFTTITTGSWTAGSSSSTTFTAPNGPVSVWMYGYTGTTGYVMSNVSIKPVESGITTAINVPLLTARNTDGTVLTAAATVGGFGLSNGAGTATYLFTENAQANTKTDSVAWEVALGNGYTAGRDITVTANALYSGAGTVGATKSLTATAYLISDSAGTQGANLIATAAATLTNAAADYTFTITGATLSANSRVIVRFTLAIQETGGASTLAGRINSVRLS